MFLDATKIPEIHRLLATESPTAIEKLRGAEISLTVSLALALAHRAKLNSGKTECAATLSRLELPGVSRAIGCLGHSGAQLSPEPFGAPIFDLYRIGSRQDLLSDEWSLFYDRFRRSAANGRTSPMFRAVGGVLGEMGDNVFWHAFEAENRPCPALAGFHVTPAAACFCVADLGQGFLRSLRRSPKWAALNSDNEALDAVVIHQATSRDGEESGGGFKQLFNSLLDFNGLVILRSGACTYRLENCGDVRRAISLTSSPTPGSSITVVISLDQSMLVESPLILS